MSRGFFITGTDTDVGKTTVALGIMAALQKKGLRVAAMKPVSAGCEDTNDGLRNEDARRLMAQASLALPYELVNPYAFAPPIAPHIAAQQAGVQMQIAPLLEAYRQIARQVDIVIVEGAGGWLVPFNQQLTMADLALALQLPVINVVGIRLGCLNHAQLTTNSIQTSGLQQTAWVANRLAPDMPQADDNIHYLRRHLAGDLLGKIAYCKNTGVESIASQLDVSPLM